VGLPPVGDDCGAFWPTFFTASLFFVGLFPYFFLPFKAADVGFNALCTSPLLSGRFCLLTRTVLSFSLYQGLCSWASEIFHRHSFPLLLFG